MEATFETYKQGLMENITMAQDFDELDNLLFGASCDLDGYRSYDISDEAMAAIIRKSEASAEKKVYSMDEVERIMDDKIYELTHRMDAYCVAEPIECL